MSTTADEEKRFGVLVVTYGASDRTALFDSPSMLSIIKPALPISASLKGDNHGGGPLRKIVVKNVIAYGLCTACRKHSPETGPSTGDVQAISATTELPFTNETREPKHAC